MGKSEKEGWGGAGMTPTRASKINLNHKDPNNMVQPTALIPLPGGQQNPSVRQQLSSAQFIDMDGEGSKPEAPYDWIA